MSLAFRPGRKRHRLVGLLVAACFGLAASHAALGFTVDVTADADGNGLITSSNGFSATLPFGFENDPGPGGLPSVLTYSLLNAGSFGLNAGDLLIDEPVLGGSPGALVRFNPSETCTDGTVGCLVFYENPVLDSLAGTPNPPTALYADNLTLTASASGIVIYTPVSGQPGFVPGNVTTYDLITVTDLPEPASFGLLGIALAGLGIARRRRWPF